MPPASDKPADPLVEKPPADSPIESAWAVFDRMVIPRKFPGEMQRYMRHAFYAGARSAFQGLTDALTEMDEGEPDGDTRLAAVEREIDAYFTDIIGRAAISRTGKV